MARRKHSNATPFIDLLFLLLVGITFLFLLAFILIKPITEDKKIDSKAEFIVTLDWPDHHNSDIDLWIKDPLGNTVGYAMKEVGFTTLERDDIGSNRDTHTNSKGTVVYNPVNTELISIRGIIGGEWVVNVHYYASRKIPDNHISGKVTPAYESIDRVPVPNVKVKVIQLNPKYKVIAEKTIILTFQGEERTMARFLLDEDGKFVRSIAAPSKFIPRRNFGDGR